MLPTDAEEIANYWCAAADSDYGKKQRFICNFWAALMSKLAEDHVLRQQNAAFEDVDFSKIKQVSAFEQYVARSIY